MNAEEFEKIVARHEMRCLELKESFNVGCIETACASSLHEGRILSACAGWTRRCGLCDII